MSIISDVLANRLTLLQSINSTLSFEGDTMDTPIGTRALIRVLDNGELIALEFIEPEGMWSESDVLEEYAETVEEGINTTIIVSENEKDKIREEFGQDSIIKIISYDEIGSSLQYML